MNSKSKVPGKRPSRERPRRPSAHRGRPGARIPGAADPLPAGLAPRKSPRQERSRTTVDAILEAALDLLASRGHGATSTNAIARRAGVSVGSLYQYFPNKDAIVAALFERHAASIDRVVQALLADLRCADRPVRAAFARMFDGFAAVHDADPKLEQALAPQADGRREMAGVVSRREERFRSELAAALDGRSDVRPGNRGLMASLLFDTAEAVTRSLMHGDARRFPREEAFEEALTLMCGYLVR
jgi:AcrR family transcriptional regulator